MKLNRRQFLRTSLAAASLSSVKVFPAQSGNLPISFKFEPDKNVIPAPSDPEQWPEFRRQLNQWRVAKKREMNYSDALYRRPDFAWVSSSFACCFLMVCDETFYDWKSGQYRVREFVEQGRRDFGGYDSIVLWHAYPRIGLDDRNQFDFYRDMPGGLVGLRRVVDEFHQYGLKVYIDYNPWDTHTRREGKDDVDALADLVAALDVDGIFLDTMDKGAEAFRAKLDAVRPGVVLEGEIALPLTRLHDHHMSWAQWFGDSTVPGVLRNKWFERRHMQHQIDRWNRDHSVELQRAWLNGSGMMVWENVFGSWVGWNARDRSLLRSMLPIQRYFAHLLAGESWVPLVPTLQPNVYASLWQEKGLRLFTLVNRSEEKVEGDLLSIPVAEEETVWDLIVGESVRTKAQNQEKVIQGAVPPRGIGCFLVAPKVPSHSASFPAGEGFVSAGALDTSSAPQVGKPATQQTRKSALRVASSRQSGSLLADNFEQFLEGQRQINQRAQRDTSFPQIEVKQIPVERTRSYTRSNLPSDMAVLPAASLTLKVEFRARECAYYESSHPQGAGNPSIHHPTFFERKAVLKSFAMDLTLVTNAQFAEFLKTSHYQPRFPENFLKHWVQDRPLERQEDHPVVYVDLEDARAYARWAGKRLPTEEEWQYAAQGLDGRSYPWGQSMEPGCCNDGSTGGTTPVKAFPKGRSPFGLYDMCGNVWQWTESERSDGRTRFAILRGGSFYRRGGSDWYFDEGPRPARFAAKMLLMWPGLDRCANIGFRCVADVE